MDFHGFEVFPSILIGCVYLLGVYWLATGPARRRLGWSDDVRPGFRRAASWTAAVLVIFFSLNGPLHEWADGYLFTAHMVQHLLLMLLMPPLLIWGLPPELIRKALQYRPVLAVGRFLTHPVIAYVAYNVVFIFWHFPHWYNMALMDHTVHIVQHLSFMVVAVMMWWPIMSPVRELVRIPTGPFLMAWIFLFGIPGTVVSALITLSNEVLYTWYAAAPRITALSPLDDQRLGGLIMWIPGMLVFWIAITVVFFRWTSYEYRSWREDPEALPTGETGP
ncbi:MAG: cytochrome c oxidase assembly protein [Gemmatimonadales bacterium]|nr:MAG: cytochrome c oxidase assembly protein [Gemmatimonadales bacterium]